MLHFSTQFRCPQCRHTFAVCVHSDGPLDSQARYVIRCPQDGVPYTVVFSGTLRPVDSCPKGAVEACAWQPGSSLR
jgi:hypothetical protein